MRETLSSEAVQILSSGKTDGADIILNGAISRPLDYTYLERASGIDRSSASGAEGFLESGV